MQILFENITTSQMEFVAFVICLVLIVLLIYLSINIVKQHETIKEQFLASIMCFAMVIGLLATIINQRINYETIHTKKIIFTEQQNYKVNDEITIYPELKGYRVTEIEGKIYTVELREKEK